MAIERLLPPQRLGEIRLIGSGFEERQRGPDHVGKIGRKSREAEAAAAKRMTEPIAAAHAGGDEPEGSDGHFHQLGRRQHDRELGQGGDHQPVPVGQDLVVKARSDACGADPQELVTQPPKPLFGGGLGGRALAGIVEAIEDIVTFEIALGAAP